MKFLKPQEDIKFVMPPRTFLNDEQITGVITYIRNTWGNTGPATVEKVVRKVRGATPDRQYPWTEAELIRETQ